MDRKKLSVINTSKEITQLLQTVFTQLGFETSVLYTYEIKDSIVDFETFIQSNRPDVIIFDISIPYEENYRLFKGLVASEVAKKIPFILTTTNKEALEKLCGETNSFELIGKPYDLQVIIDAVNNAYDRMKKLDK